MEYGIKEKLEAINKMLEICNVGGRMSTLLKNNDFSDEDINMIRSHLEEFANGVLDEFPQVVCEVAYELITELNEQ